MVTDAAYAELGLAPGASEAEVKAAWRRLVARWHPDRNPSAAAIGRMQRINQAFEVLREAGFPAPPAAPPEREAHTPREPGRRPRAQAAAPRRGRKAQAGPAPEPPPAARRSPEAPEAPEAPEPAGAPLQRKLKLSLEEAAAGCVKPLRGRLLPQCGDCAGRGLAADPDTCRRCEGQGRVRASAWYGWLGTFEACPDCAGQGRVRRPCGPCGGSGRLPAHEYRLSVRIPPGVRDGDLLHVPGRRVHDGHPPLQFDLQIALQPHPLLALEPDGRVLCAMPVDAFAWLAERTLEVPTLLGPQPLALRRGQLEYRLPGLGFPVERRGARGDQVVRVEPLFPERLDSEQRRLLDRLADSIRSGDGRPDPRLAEWNRAAARWARQRRDP